MKGIQGIGIISSLFRVTKLVEGTNNVRLFVPFLWVVNGYAYLGFESMKIF